MTFDVSKMDRISNDSMANGYSYFLSRNGYRSCHRFWKTQMMCYKNTFLVRSCQYMKPRYRSCRICPPSPICIMFLAGQPVPHWFPIATRYRVRSWISSRCQSPIQKQHRGIRCRCVVNRVHRSMQHVAAP